MKIETFECDGEKFGVSLPPDRLGEVQLVFCQGERQLVVCFPNKKRIDLAFSLLTADGMEAYVSLSRPRPRCVVCGDKTDRKSGGQVIHKRCEPPKVGA